MKEIYDEETECPVCGQETLDSEMLDTVSGKQVCDDCLCGECDGDGGCMDCGGDGQCSHCGAECPECGGSCECPECDGKGYKKG
jgi:hypothetical protein